MRTANLTDYQKDCIKRGSLKGIKPKVISDILGISSERIWQYVSRNKANFDLPPKVVVKDYSVRLRIGRCILSIIEYSPRISIAKIPGLLRRDFDCQSWVPGKTWIRLFLKSKKLAKLALQLKPPINERIKGLRSDFAKKWLVDGVCLLDNVFWTDEVKVQSHPNARRIKEWMPSGTPLKNRRVQPKIQGGKFSVMFWGSFSKLHTGRLKALEETMNGEKYIQMIEDELIPEFNHAKSHFSGDWRLMQDNAPCHRARIVKEFLRRNEVQFIDWPPYSPDLNPIENIWSWMKQKLYSEYPPASSRDELIEFFEEIF